jgi:hypothetical protein
MVRRVFTVALEAAEYRALVTIAERERRKPAAQAAILLRQRLARVAPTQDAGPAPPADRP